MTDISELVVRIKADASQLDRELKKTTGTVTNASNQMSSAVSGLSRQFVALASGLSVAAIVGFAKQASLAADRLNDLSARTGVAATTLSALELPLKQSGSSAEEFASSITRMNNAIGEAASGQSESAVRAFTDLGLSIQNLMSMTPEQQFEAIAQALNSIENQAEFTNKGMAIFGRQFASIAPVIRETGGAMSEFVKRQQELGNAFTASELQMVNDFWDSYEGGVKKLEVAVIRLILRMKEFLSLAVPEGVSIGKNPFDTTAGISIGNSSENVSTTKPDNVDKITFKNNPNDNGNSNKKNNQLAEYKQSLERELQMAGLGERDQAAMAAKFKTIDAAKAQGVKASEAMIKANQELALKAYDTKEALDRQTKAQEDAKRATERFNDVLKDKLSAGLTDAIFTADNAGDAFKRMALSIAQSIFERTVAKPITDGIFDAISGGDIASGLSALFGDMPSFDVGSANIPNDMIAQIHKGERIVPANQNNPQGLAALAGGSGGGVTVNQYFQTGVSRAELQAVLPQVASAAHDAVFASIQKGGSAAKIVGIR